MQCRLPSIPYRLPLTSHQRQAASPLYGCTTFRHRNISPRLLAYIAHTSQSETNKRQLESRLSEMPLIMALGCKSYSQVVVRLPEGAKISKRFSVALHHCLFQPRLYVRNTALPPPCDRVAPLCAIMPAPAAPQMTESELYSLPCRGLGARRSIQPIRRRTRHAHNRSRCCSAVCVRRRGVRARAGMLFRRDHPPRSLFSIVLEIISPPPETKRTARPIKNLALCSDI